MKLFSISNSSCPSLRYSADDSGGHINGIPKGSLTDRDGVRDGFCVSLDEKLGDGW